MRTRFAPSPTGYLHIGGLRTALLSYIIAKQSDGKFILRIEDTDQARSVTGATEDLIQRLHWAGMNPDEGVMLKDGKLTEEGTYGPYVQSQRLEIYRQYAEELRKKGHAYPCFCSPERLEKMREDQQAHKQAPMYDRLCMSLSEEEIEQKIAAGEPYVLRLKVPREESISFEDDIRGTMQFKGHTVDDQVLMKSDGFPTYHLAHVVDDHLMDIGLVIRGEEWLSSTPKHLLLFEYLGWKPPRYAHIALILNKDKSKLSKRQNDVAVGDYIEQGYLPEALINFIALLGWNPGTTQDIFSMDDLIEQFSLDRVQKSGAIFDRDKLDWLQGQWMRKMDIKDFAAQIHPFVATEFPEANADANFKQKAALIQERLTFFHEAAEMLGYFYEDPKVDPDLLANEKQKVTKEMVPEVISLLIETLEAVDEKSWTEEKLKDVLFALADKKDYKKGQILWPLRAALTGLPYSPGAFEVASVLGKEATITRLKTVA